MVGARRRIVVGALLAAVLGGVLVAPLHAHEIFVHERITNAAIDYLIARRPDLRACGLPEIRRELGRGSIAEDDPFSRTLPDREYIGRFLFHFLPALNDSFRVTHLPSGTGGTVTTRSSCSSLQWLDPSRREDPSCSSSVDFSLPPFPVCVGLACVSLTTLGDRLDRAVQNANPGRTRADMLAALRRIPGAQKDDGLFSLGHYLHLLQDLTSPAHTRNDAHPEGIPNVDQIRLDPSLFEALNKHAPFIGMPTAPLLQIGDDMALFESLQQSVSTFYHSEKSAAADASLSQRALVDGYAVDDFGRKLAKREWVTGLYTIDDVIAFEQFDELSATAVLYTASAIAYVHDNLAPVCEQELEVRVMGRGAVTSTVDGVRSEIEPNQIVCGPDAPALQTCRHTFRSGSWVELTATGEDFRGWSDPQCPGTGPCRVRMDGIEPLIVTADFGDPVAGVYDLIAFQGFPVPTPILNGRDRVLSGEIRLSEVRVWTGPGSFEDGRISGGFTGELYTQPTNPPIGPYEILDFDTYPGPYRVGAFSEQPVPPFPTSTDVLPPGLVLHLGSSNLVVGTLSADGQTLSLWTGWRDHDSRPIIHSIATLRRRALTRTIGLAPADRLLAFPETRQGDVSDTLAIALTNTGTDPLSIRDVWLDGGLNFAIAQNWCDPILPPASTCTIDIEFRPWLTYTTGVRTGTVIFNSNAGSTSGTIFREFRVDIEGTATGEPAATISPAALHFPATAQFSVAPPQTVTIQNTGDLPLRLGTMFSTNFGFGVDRSACGIALDPGQSCPVRVSYGPAGAFQATLNIQSNSGSTAGSRFASSTVALAADNAAPVARAIAHNPLVRVGSSAFVSDGSSDLEGRPLTYEWALVSQPFGSNVTLEGATNSFVSFRPGVAGQYVVRLVVSDGLAFSAPDEIVITAELDPGVLTVTPAGLEFPQVSIGARSPTETLTILNNGPRAVSIGAIQVTGSFGVDTNVCPVLAAGDSCRIPVFFQPFASGGHTGSVVILSDAENDRIVVPLTGAFEPGADPVVVGHIVHVTGNWRLTHESGDADDYFWGYGRSAGALDFYVEMPDDGFSYDILFGPGNQGVILFNAEMDDDDPTDDRPAFVLMQRLSADVYRIYLDDDDDQDFEPALLLVRLP